MYEINKLAKTITGIENRVRNLEVAPQLAYSSVQIDGQAVTIPDLAAQTNASAQAATRALTDATTAFERASAAATLAAAADMQAEAALEHANQLAQQQAAAKQEFDNKMSEVNNDLAELNQELENLDVTEHIAAGSIGTDKLAANAITGDKIAANAIMAPHIDAGAVTAEAIATNALNGKIIVGAEIKSSENVSATGGIHIKEQSLELYGPTLSSAVTTWRRCTITSCQALVTDSSNGCYVCGGKPTSWIVNQNGWPHIYECLKCHNYYTDNLTYCRFCKQMAPDGQDIPISIWKDIVSTIIEKRLSFTNGTFEIGPQLTVDGYLTVNKTSFFQGTTSNGTVWNRGHTRLDGPLSTNAQANFNSTVAFNDQVEFLGIPLSQVPITQPSQLTSKEYVDTKTATVNDRVTTVNDRVTTVDGRVTTTNTNLNTTNTNLTTLKNSVTTSMCAAKTTFPSSSIPDGNFAWYFPANPTIEFNVGTLANGTSPALVQSGGNGHGYQNKTAGVYQIHFWVHITGSPSGRVGIGISFDGGNQEPNTRDRLVQMIPAGPTNYDLEFTLIKQLSVNSSILPVLFNNTGKNITVNTAQLTVHRVA